MVCPTEQASTLQETRVRSFGAGFFRSSSLHGQIPGGSKETLPLGSLGTRLMREREARKLTLEDTGPPMYRSANPSFSDSLLYCKRLSRRCWHPSARSALSFGDSHRFPEARSSMLIQKAL